MGIYDGDGLVDIQTPDGRTLKIPSSVAAMLHLPPPAPPPAVTDELAGAPGAPQPAPLEPLPLAPDAISAAAPATPAPPAPLPPPQPDVAAQDTSPKGARVPAETPPPAPMGAAPATPQGAVNEVRSATDQQAAAGIHAADTAAAGQVALANAMEERNKQLDPLFVKRQQDAEAGIQATAAKNAELESMRKTFANKKIDRSVDHPILAAISLALSGLGSAMKKEGTNPALDILWKAIDRKVAGQMADLEKMGTTIGYTREEAARLEKATGDKLARNNLLIATEGEKAARQFEAIAARTSSETIKAEALQNAAAMREKAAGITLAAVQNQRDADERAKEFKQELGFKNKALGSENWRFSQGQKQQWAIHGDEMQIQREKMAFDASKADQALRASGDAAAQKAYQEQKDKVDKNGVKLLTTNDYLLTNKGKQMMSQADAFEAKAKEIEDKGVSTQPQSLTAQAYRDKAAILRDHARVEGTALYRGPEQAAKLGEQYAAAQRVTRLSDEINTLYDANGRSYLETTEGQAALQAKRTSLAMAIKTAWELGVLSKLDMGKVEEAIGKDPTKGWDSGNVMHAIGLGAGERPENFKARMGALVDDMQADTADKLRAGTSWDGKDPEELFRNKKKIEPNDTTKAISAIERGKTPMEEAASRRGASTARNVVGATFYPLSGTPESQAKALEQSGSLKYPGLSKDQGDAFETALQASKKGGKAGTEAQALLIDSAVKSRPEVALPLMQNLRDNSPEMYNKALAKLPANSPVREQLAIKPPAQDDSVASAVAKSVVMQQTPVTALYQQAIVEGRQGPALKELATRAQAGDKDAQNAVDAYTKNYRPPSPWGQAASGPAPGWSPRSAGK